MTKGVATLYSTPYLTYSMLNRVFLMFYKTVRLIETGHLVFALLEILNSWSILALKRQNFDRFSSF